MLRFPEMFHESSVFKLIGAGELNNGVLARQIHVGRCEVISFHAISISQVLLPTSILLQLWLLSESCILRKPSLKRMLSHEMG